jgi:hypothetical protein
LTASQLILFNIKILNDGSICSLNKNYDFSFLQKPYKDMTPNETEPTTTALSISQLSAELKNRQYSKVPTATPKVYNE